MTVNWVNELKNLLSPNGFALFWFTKQIKFVAKNNWKSSINKFYGCVDLKVIFQTTRRIQGLFLVQGQAQSPSNVQGSK